VVGVNWFEAIAFTNWLSKETGEKFRLPTEAEWEKAARSANGRKFPWGDKWESHFCNAKESRLNRTNPVGIFPKDKSPNSCMDMAGNVWEWCSDWFGENYYSNCALKNPKGPESGSLRILRGGSWFCFPGSCRVTSRLSYSQELRDDGVGFRLAKSV
jgi:formylglycine-generating enzyme required for sulfatase activity